MNGVGTCLQHPVQNTEASGIALSLRDEGTEGQHVYMCKGTLMKVTNAR